MTYDEIYYRNMLIQAIPLAGLKGSALSAALMLQVDSQRAAAAFESRMADALKKLKEEKCPRFDEEGMKPEEERCPEYKQWLAELEADYAALRADEAAKEAEGVNAPKVTRKTIEAICEGGADGVVTLPGGEKPLPKAALLQALAAMVED